MCSHAHAISVRLKAIRQQTEGFPADVRDDPQAGADPLTHSCNAHTNTHTRSVTFTSSVTIAHKLKSQHSYSPWARNPCARLDRKEESFRFSRCLTPEHTNMCVQFTAQMIMTLLKGLYSKINQTNIFSHVLLVSPEHADSFWDHLLTFWSHFKNIFYIYLWVKLSWRCLQNRWPDIYLRFPHILS